MTWLAWSKFLVLAEFSMCLIFEAATSLTSFDGVVFTFDTSTKASSLASSK